MFKKFSLAGAGAFSSLVLPVLALAAPTPTGVSTTYINSILNAVESTLKALVPLLISIAFVILLIYIVRYIWGGADGKDASRSGIVWSIIALAVMLSIWGLVGLVQNIAGVSNSSTPATPPTLPPVPAIQS